ncbi:MAG: threonine/serine exporter family protein [Clostridia bacterium]|nr:threonine/serine exporter family protein [Clostridia bacterium]
MKSNEEKQLDLEAILDFCVEIGRRMMLAGANLERVQLAIARIASAYRLMDVSVYLLSGYLSVGARDAEGNYASRQGAIGPSGIHLFRLKKLNRLCFTVADKTPAPTELSKMLETASNVREMPDVLIMIAQVLALSCLCFLFGGSYREVIAVAITVVAMHYLLLLTDRMGIDRLVANALVMFLATVIVIVLLKLGLSTNGPVILITVSMLVIPGIPLVNAMRNLLCGNEMNGILQILKITIETLALGVGIYLALWVFGMREGMSDAVVTTLSDPILLVLLSFGASTCFGFVFRIAPRDLWIAGLGGVLTRIVLLVMQQFTGTRLLFITVAAMAASLYAELWARKERDPSTYFLYPAIVPLIPGDLFYYSLVGLYRQDRAMFETNGVNCLLVLCGMSIGFVLSSIIAHQIRRRKHVRVLKTR